MEVLHFLCIHLFCTVVEIIYISVYLSSLFCFIDPCISICQYHTVLAVVVSVLRLWHSPEVSLASVAFLIWI